MKVTVVLLAKTDSEALFEMTCNCIRSLLDSEKEIAFEIIIIESNNEYESGRFQYPDFVKVIVPAERFNFHRFLNIGIKEATGDFIALCNNDLIFYSNWFSAILEVSQQHKDILSFSPLHEMNTDKNRDFLIGYKVTQQIKGWCIVVKACLFNTTGPLDETFSFYFADNDYGMTLKYWNIKHALVYNAYVQHLEKKSTQIVKLNPDQKAGLLKKYQIPKYLLESQYDYLFTSESTLLDFLKFHNKWGSPKVLYRKNRIADFLMRYKLGYLNRLFLKIKI